MRRHLLVMAAIGLVAGCSERGDEAIRLLRDIEAGPAPSELKATTPRPRRQLVSYAGRADRRTADLYTSPDGSRAGLVLVPGLAPDGKDDPRLVAFAESLARVRFAVLVPDIASLRRLQVRPEQADDIADAARWMSNQRALVPAGRLGLVAISYAVGPALIAAQAGDLSERIRFVLGIGGYYDMPELIRYVTTGHVRTSRAGDHREYSAPNQFGKWLFVKSNAARLSSPDDIRRVIAMADRKLDNPAADVAGLIGELGPEGRAVHDLVTNTDPDRVTQLIAGLSDGIRRDIASLDLSRHDLSAIAAKLILVHGRDDDVIPYNHSQWLADAVGPDRASLYLVDGLWHVDTTLTLADQLTLWDAAIDLLAQRGAR